jgi:phenylalanyl-tRNA synthetase beta chain
MKVSRNWLKEWVAFDDFSTLATLFSLHSQEVEDLRPLTAPLSLIVGQVTQAAPHPDATKLTVCQVDVGTTTLQIVCGAPNVAPGQKVIVAPVGTTLPGRVIQEVSLRGVISQGMICSLPEIGIEPPFGDASGIEVLPDEAVVGSDPLTVLHLDDVVMDLALTPNRADLQSMMGVAYDTAAILNLPVTLPNVHVTESNTPNPVSIRIETKGCLSYTARVLEGLSIAESPAWLKARLIAAGLRPINNVVDITNYIMLETGQPLHAFDLDKFDSHEVVVRVAKDRETITALDEIERVLTAEDVVITNGRVATAIGGVKGGLDTGIDATTKRVLLESATFSPVHIRKTAQRLELRSEASSRFEKGVDPTRTILALERATMMLQALAGGTVNQGIAQAGVLEKAPVTIIMSVAAIQAAIGMNITKEALQALLERYHFAVTTTADELRVTIPTRRQDVVTTQDLIEEIVRLYGPNNLPSTIPLVATTGGLQPQQRRRRQLRRLLSGLGYHETVTYSLVAKELAPLGGLQADPLVHVASPMSETKTTLRQTVLPSLLDIVKYHHARQVFDVRLFELSHIHNTAYDEVVAGAVSGATTHAIWNNKKTVTFHDAKGVVERIFELLGVSPRFVFAAVPDLFHPGQSALIQVGDAVVGVVGKVHPTWQKTYDIKETFVYEIRLSALQQDSSVVAVQPVPKIPAVTRELTFVVPLGTPADGVIDAVHEAPTTYVTAVRVYDVYHSETTAMTLSFTFQDPHKTLSSENVQADVDAVVAHLSTQQIRFKDVTS